MADKLDPQEALEAIENCGVYNQQAVLEYAYNTIKQMMDDYAPVVHAHWIRGERLDRFWCSHCNRITYTNIIPFVFDYCFSCGAKMDDIGDQSGM